MKTIESENTETPKGTIKRDDKDQRQVYSQYYSVSNTVEDKSQYGHPSNFLTLRDNFEMSSNTNNSPEKPAILPTIKTKKTKSPANVERVY